VSGYLAAIEGADVAAAGDYWAEDARLIAPGVSLDRASLLDGVRSIFGAGTRVRVQRRTVELFVHDNAAYEIAQAEEVFATPGSARPDTTRNNMFVRWEKGADGLWRFSRAVVGPQGAGAQ
jgi:ketosteroid isomerase-like protein